MQKVTWTVRFSETRISRGTEIRNEEQSRQDWEQELREIQQSVTPEQGLRAAHLISKRSSGALISDFAHLLRFLLGALLLTLGIVTFNFSIPHNLPVGLSALIVGCYLAFSALHQHRKKK
jgi:hypothetical protein